MSAMYSTWVLGVPLDPALASLLDHWAVQLAVGAAIYLTFMAWLLKGS